MADQIAKYEILDDVFIEKDKLYLHYKRGLYAVLCFSREERTGIMFVVYYLVGQSDIIWHSPVREWYEVVEYKEGKPITRFTEYKV